MACRASAPSDVAHNVERAHQTNPNPRVEKSATVMRSLRQILRFIESLPTLHSQCIAKSEANKLLSKALQAMEEYVYICKQETLGKLTADPYYMWEHFPENFSRFLQIRIGRFGAA